MKKANVTAATYKSHAVIAAESFQRHGTKLGEIARNLSVAGDFSPCTIDAMRAELESLKDLQVHLKSMIDLSVQRGCTHFDEQKEKLLEGNLRLNRREPLDQAAE